MLLHAETILLWCCFVRAKIPRARAERASGWIECNKTDGYYYWQRTIELFLDWKENQARAVLIFISIGGYLRSTSLINFIFVFRYLILIIIHCYQKLWFLLLTLVSVQVSRQCLNSSFSWARLPPCPCPLSWTGSRSWIGPSSHFAGRAGSLSSLPPYQPRKNIHFSKTQKEDFKPKRHWLCCGLGRSCSYN